MTWWGWVALGVMFLMTVGSVGGFGWLLFRVAEDYRINGAPGEAMNERERVHGIS